MPPRISVFAWNEGSRLKRPRKILLAIAGTVAAFILLAMILLPFVVNAERLRPQAEAKLQAALGRRVSLGALKLSLWGGLALHAGSLRIGEPIAGPARGALLLDAGPTAIHVAWLPLLRRNVEVRSIAIEGARLTQDARPLLSDGRVSSRLRISVDGTVAAEGWIEGALSALTAAPRVRAEFAAALRRDTLEIASVDVTAGEIRIEAAGRVSGLFSQAPRLALEGAAKLKRSELRGKLDLVVAAQPKATFDLLAPLLDADEIMAAVARLSGTAPAHRAGFSLVPAANAGETVAAAGGPSFARLLEASGSIRAERCLAHGLEMTDLSMRLSLAGGLAEVHDITFALYGGRARGSLSLRPFEPQIPFSLDQTAEGIAIRPLIAALAPAQAGTMEGNASLAVRLSGDAGGTTLLPSMKGTGRVAIEDGKIVSLGVIKQVMQLLEVAGAKGIAKDETPFDHLSAHFDLAEGAAITKDLEFRSHDLDGDGAGSVGLGGALRIDVLASFAKAVSDELVAKTHALSIRQGPDGRLSVPLQIRGTIHDPRIQLDLDKVIKEGALKQLKKEGTKSLLKKLLGR